VNDGRPFFRSDFFSLREFRDLDVFAESFSLLGWTDHAAVHVPTDDAHVIFIGLERSGTVTYTERDRLMLELAQAQLANARRLACARDATRGAHSGRSAQPPDLAVFQRAGFSRREAETLLWLTEGKSNAEIARLMSISVAAVKYHLTSIFNKTGMGNRLAVTLHALDLIKRHRLGAAAVAGLPRLAKKIPSAADERP
jgi:DNA-binding CsgD family transcriptional regulator